MDDRLKRHRQDPEAARAATTAAIGVELMNAYNKGKTDPSLMAILGHETRDGFLSAPNATA